MRNLKTRRDRLEQESVARLGSKQCDNCRDWRSICVQRIEADSTEVWETEEPRECPVCGWQPVLVAFHIVDDWRSVTPPSRRR
jgi:hypothetical protein